MIADNSIADLTPIASLANLTTLFIDHVHYYTLDPQARRNPINVATGLGVVSGISNPFFLSDRLSVRYGILKDRAAGQFVGIATRVGRSNIFEVRMTDASPVIYHWIFSAIQPSAEFIVGGEYFDPREPPATGILGYFTNPGYYVYFPRVWSGERVEEVQNERANQWFRNILKNELGGPLIVSIAVKHLADDPSDIQRLQTQPVISLVYPEDRTRAIVDPQRVGDGLMQMTTFDAHVA